MKIDVLTLFPEFFNQFNNWSIIGRAVEDGKVDISYTNIRDYSKNKHKKVDDYPYGGGPGMVMSVDVIDRSIKSVRDEDSFLIFMSPQGKKLDQELVNQLVEKEHLILLCGHYEGIDNRVIENYVDMEVSIGDYVLTGGEIPAMALMDSVIRLLPEVLSSEESFEDESHYNGLLEYPQYTRPREYDGHEVPEILLSGNHGKIEYWRLYKSIETTYIKRPDMLENKELSEKEEKILREILDEKK